MSWCRGYAESIWGVFTLTIFVVSCGTPTASELSGLGKAPVSQQTIIPEHYVPSGFLVSEAAVTGPLGQQRLDKIMQFAAASFFWIVRPENAAANPSLTHERIRLFDARQPGTISPWARDWGAFSALGQREDVVRLLDTNNPTSSAAEQDVVKLIGDTAGYEVVDFPIAMPHSNFMNNGYGDCFAEESVIRANGDRTAGGRAHIEDLFRTFAGCRRVVYLTGFGADGFDMSLDEWAKFISDQEVLVAEVASFDEAAKSPASEGLAIYLDNQSATIRKLGYQVIRVPLILDESVDGKVRVYSWTASLIHDKTLFMPDFQILMAKNEPLYDKLTDRMRGRLAGKGFNVEMLPADDLIEAGGNLHRAFQQVSAKR